jgi:hypothetical protein
LTRGAREDLAEAVFCSAAPYMVVQFYYAASEVGAATKKFGDYALDKQVPIGAYLKHEERAIDHRRKNKVRND